MISHPPPARAAVRLATLAEAGVDRWFDLDPPPPHPQAAAARLREAVRSGAVDPGLRLVALRGQAVVGRCAARSDPGGRLYFWQPAFAPGLSPTLRYDLAKDFLAACESLAAARGLRYLDTKPADDLLWPRRWLAILAESGFCEAACAHLFDCLPAAAPPAPDPLRRECRIVAAGTLSDARLRHLVYECDRETLDRGAALYTEPESHWNDIVRLRAVPWSRARSAVALLGPAPAGLILPGEETATGDGWILYVGVVPPARRHGIASALLQRALAGFRETGVARVRALVDDVNIPSVRLHARAGFRRRPGRFMHYRKELPPPPSSQPARRPS